MRADLLERLYAVQSVDQFLKFKNSNSLCGQITERNFFSDLWQKNWHLIQGYLDSPCYFNPFYLQKSALSKIAERRVYTYM